MKKYEMKIEVDDVPLPAATEETYATAEGRAARERIQLEKYLSMWQQAADVAASKIQTLKDHINLCKRIQGQ